MPAMSALPAPPPKPLRSDGADARRRLLDAAIALFADKGFAKTSTREIAQSAQVNVASISYYFGDKAGLYRAAWMDPRCNPDVQAADFNGASLSLAQALHRLLRGFIEPLQQGELVHKSMKLHYREMLEPTGIWQEEIDSRIKPAHLALVAVVCRHLGVTRADDDIHRLCFAIAGLGMTLHVAGDVFTAIRPQLLATPAALEVYVDRLLIYATALVDAEAARRAQARPTKTPQLTTRSR